MDGKTFGSYLTYENNTSTNAESNIRRRAGTLRTYSGAHAARAVAMGLFTRGDGNVGASTSGVLPSPPPLKSGGFAASGLFDAPAPRGVLTNPGWRDRVLEGTAWSFAAGLVGGAGHALYRAELDFAPHIAAVAGNVTLVGATFLCCREMTRLVRQQDDWITSATGGALAGSALATAFRGRPYSPAGALLVGGLAGGIHFAMDTDGSATMYARWVSRRWQERTARTMGHPGVVPCSKDHRRRTRKQRDRVSTPSRCGVRRADDRGGGGSSARGVSPSASRGEEPKGGRLRGARRRFSGRRPPPRRKTETKRVVLAEQVA